MAKKITLDNGTEVIADTMVYDIDFEKEIISTVCKYCGEPVSIHAEEKYDYEDRYSWTVKELYCPKQCDGVIAEYEEQEEKRKALERISDKYYSRRGTTFDKSKIFFRETQKYIDKINKEHEEKIRKYNDTVANTLDRDMAICRMSIRKKEG